jgi:peptidyl-dipeptidase Dcp
MNTFQDQWIDEQTGKNIRPHVTLVMNLTKTTVTNPFLLTFYDLQTFLLEFGHAFECALSKN